VLQSQITNLQSNIVVTGTNLGVGLGALEQLTTGTNNIAIGLGAASGQYGLTTSSGNLMIGINSGPSCVTGGNNTFLGYNTLMYGTNYIVGSIALGANAKITFYNQLMVAPITQFNMPGLTPSTGTSAGTILEFDSAGNIIPTARQGHTKLSQPLTRSLLLSMPLITFSSLPQLYQAQKITSPLSHGGV